MAKELSLLDKVLLAVEKVGSPAVHKALQTFLSKNQYKLSLPDKVFIAVEKKGSFEIEQIILKTLLPKAVFDDPKTERIVTLISDKMKVPVHEIIFGVGRKNERKIAIGFCCHYLNIVLKKKPEAIADILDIAVCNYYRYNSLVKKLDPRHPNDEKFFTIKQELDTALI